MSVVRNELCINEKSRWLGGIHSYRFCQFGFNRINAYKIHAYADNVNILHALLIKGLVYCEINTQLRRIINCLGEHSGEHV